MCKPVFQDRWAGAGLVQICFVLLTSALMRPAFATDRAQAISASTVQQQAAAIDTRYADQKPLLKRGLESGSAQGANAQAWGTSPRSIEKISVVALGERGRVLLDFYWRQGSLIAAREKRIDYGEYSAQLPKEQLNLTNVVADDWLEFAGRVLLKRRTLDGDMPINDDDAREQATSLTAEARSYKRLMSIPKTKANRTGACSWSCAREKSDECFAYVCK
jgi:hypothetical protein